MKRILFIIIISIFCLTTQKTEAQNTDNIQHLEFRNIPIDGPATTFISKLKQYGYIQTEASENIILLKGDFAGFKNCKICIICTPQSKIVESVAIFTPSMDTWSSLKSTYNKYKEIYTKKYGAPILYEKFDSPYYEGDGYEYSAVINNKCTYLSTYKLFNGEICILITSGGEIMFHYQDRANRRKSKQEENNNISNEI